MAFSHHPAPRSPRCLSRSALIAALASATTLQAALWESPGWALVGSAEAGGGYDSNLYARADGDEDSFVYAIPTLRLFRHASLTQFEVRTQLHATKFFQETTEDSYDPSLYIGYAYPFTEDTLAAQEINAAFVQSSHANADVGGRLEQRESSLSWEGNISPTGKSVWRGRAGWQRFDYAEDNYNTNETFTAGIAYLLAPHELLQLGAGYGFDFSTSTPQLDAPKTESLQHSFTLRGRGSFSSKLTGLFYVGFATIDYSGAQDRSDRDVIAGARLEWAARERLLLGSQLDRKSYFSPGGDAVTRTTFLVDAAQQLAGGFTLRVGTQFDYSDHRGVTYVRNDFRAGVTGGIEYAFTDRFSASLTGSWATQTSDIDLYEFDRTTATGRVLLRF